MIIDWKKLDPGKEKYQAYLASREWSLLREQVKQRSGGICELCKTNKGTQVHHQTYARIYNEYISDLLHVCEPCHMFQHGMESKIADEASPYGKPEWNGVSSAALTVFKQKIEQIDKIPVAILTVEEFEALIYIKLGISFSRQAYHSSDYTTSYGGIIGVSITKGALKTLAALPAPVFPAVAVLDVNDLQGLFDWNCGHEKQAVADRDYVAAGYFSERSKELSRLRSALHSLSTRAPFRFPGGAS